jgi:hypothetical protein
VIARYGTTAKIPNTYVKTKSGMKHRYAYPLDAEMKAQITPLAKPYPKKPCVTSIEGDASRNPTGKASFNTTVTLHTEDVQEAAHV